MKWKVPLYRVYHDEEDISAVNNVINRGSHWTNGPENLELEKELANYNGSKYALCFNNGTSALHAMLLAFGIGPGDEVIVPSFTFISTANSVLFAGGKPVFAEIEKDTLALDPDEVKKKITSNTKAIMPIHYGGCPAMKIEELKELAEERDILLLEDAAESLGARLNQKRVGRFGDAAMFSFCGNKLITAGEGGAIVTDSKDVFEKMKLIRSHGRAESENYFDSNKFMDYVTLGFNFRMPTIIAALILSQLRKIDGIISLRKKIAKEYDEVFSKLGIPLLPDGGDIHNVYQMYTVQVDGSKREALKKHLEEDGIMSRVYFDPVHQSYFYKNVIGDNTKLPLTDKISKTVLTLPLFASMTEEERGFVCSSIKNFVK